MKNIIALVLVGLCLTACSKEPNQVTQRLQSVNTLTLDKSSQLNNRYFTGQVVLADLTPMGFRIEGKITKINVRPGQRVQAGEVVALLDDSSSRQQWQDANAQHQLLLRNLKRSKPLLAKGLMAQSEYDELDANVRLAKVNLGIAAARLSYTKLIAPFDGAIERLNKEPHETAAAGETVVTIYRTNRTDVEIQIPDTLLLQAAGLDREANYQPQVNGEHQTDAISMAYLEHSLQMDPSVGAFIVRLTTDKPNKLIPGEAVQIRMNMDRAGLPEVEGFQVPLSAIQASASGEAFQVWRVHQGLVNPVPVEIVQMSQQGALISGPLAQGDQLITTGLSQLRPNQQVAVIATESQPQ